MPSNLCQFFRIVGGSPIKEHEYPWLCSLKSKGGHICGITLISVYPQDTILVGAAHCYNDGESACRVQFIIMEGWTIFFTKGQKLS